jgi:hydrogenase large subunit
MPWAEYGKGVNNFLAVPEFPLDTKGELFEMMGGTVIDGKVKGITSFNDEYFEKNVTESIAHSWYDGNWDKHPYDETTEPAYTKYDTADKYSWVKSPNFNGNMMQVGPAAQVLSSYMLNDKLTKKFAGQFLNNVQAIGKATGVSSAANLTEQNLVNALPSTLGRHGARAIRAACIMDMALKHWDLLVTNIGNGDKTIYNRPEFGTGEHRGFSIHEAPRGALSHWVVIKNGKIENYQAVVPSTWNFSPRDSNNMPGPCESSLVGNPIADEQAPLEALRTVHSFDPCLACAVHAFNPEGKETGSAKTRF